MRSPKVDLRAVLVVLFGAYILLAAWIRYRWGAVSTMDLFLDERVLLAIKGNPPLVENIGMTYPPLPFLLRFPLLPIAVGFTGPTLSALFGALTAVLSLWFLRRAKAPLALRRGFAVAFLFTMPWLMASTDGETAALYAFLLCVSVLGIGVYLLEKEHTSALALSGLSLGLLCAVRYEAVFIALFLALATPAILLRHGADRPILKTSALVFVWALPAIFFFASWMYLNDAFMGDPFYFLRGPNSYLQILRQGRPPQQLVPVQGVGFAQGAVMALGMAAAGAPIYLWAIWRLRSLAALLIGVAPLLAEAITVAIGWSLMPASRLAALLPLAAILLGFVKWEEAPEGAHGKRVPWPELALLGVGLALAPQLLFTSSHPNEREFMTHVFSPVAGETDVSERSIARFLDEEGASSVLMDDSIHFKVVAYHGTPRDFILPYQPHFGITLSDPALWADWVVVSADSPELDRVLSTYPTMGYEDEVGSFTLVRESGPLRVFQRTGTGPVEVEAPPPRF